MASSSSRPNHLDLNVDPKTARDIKIWQPSFASKDRHLTVNDSVMMDDSIAVTVARNLLIPMDEMLLSSRSDEEAIDDSMAFSVQCAASVSNMASRLRVRANEIQELNTENSSLQRKLHESQQEVEKLKEENNALLKLVSSYSADTQTRLDMLQISNKKILEEHERLMAKLKRRRPLPEEASRT
ncbi:hypothetical protein ACE6H2_017376 [Prunus campanulata]